MIYRTLRLLTAAGLIILAVLILVGAGLPPRNGIVLQPGQPPIAAEVGFLAPPIQTVDIHGAPFSLAALRGTPVILNFWATWCAPCVIEMPLLQTIREQYPEVRLVGINMAEPRGQVLNWTAQYSITYDILIDSDGRLAYLYMVRGVPMTIFIRRDGAIQSIVSGILSASQLAAEVSELIGVVE